MALSPPKLPSEIPFLAIGLTSGPLTPAEESFYASVFELRQAIDYYSLQEWITFPISNEMPDLETLIETLQWVESQINFVDIPFAQMNNLVSAAHNGLINAENDRFNALFEAVDDAINAQTSEIIDTLDLVSGDIAAVEGVISQVVTNGLLNLTDDIELELQDVEQRIYVELDAQTGAIVSANQTLTTTIEGEIAGLIEAMGDTNAALLDFLTDQLNSLISELIAADDFLAGTISTELERLTNQIASSNTFISAAIGGLPTDFSPVLKGVVDYALEKIQGGILNAGASVADSFADRANQTSAVIDGESDVVLDKILAAVQSDVDIDPAVKQILNIAPAGLNPIGGIIKAMTGFLVGGMASSSLLQPEIQLLLQQHSRLVKYQLLGLQDYTVALRRGLISQETFDSTVDKLGFADKEIETIAALDLQQLPPADLTSWWLRDFISEEVLEERLGKLGYVENDIATIKKSAFTVPGPADLIRFVVRDVFSPDIVSAFDLDADYPDQFTEIARKSGISEELAKWFWASHWTLPSVNMAFEMLHRDVIEEDTIDLLLKTADVLPFWRDKIKAISYNPLTRVDVRRMHKMGVLTEEEVLRAYKDTGYNEKNAQRLTEWTLLYNEPQPAEVEHAGLFESHSQTVEAFKRGILTDVMAFTLLQDLGFSDTAIEGILSQAQIEMELQDRIDEWDLLFAEYKAGIRTVADSLDLLTSRGFSQREIIKFADAVRAWVVGLTKFPSKADIGKMWKKDIISEETAVTWLKNLGYFGEVLQAYIKLFGKGKDLGNDQ